MLYLFFSESSIFVNKQIKHYTMKLLSSILGLTIVLLISCSSTTVENKEKKQKKKKEKTHYVLIETAYGDMKLKLYNETPLHRDNFLKLVNEKFYDSLLFHRVIKDFMIQGGDPESKGAEKGKQLGSGGPGYTIDAEFIPGIGHKKGALSAARKGDRQNPQKKSSGSQFYIVQGKTYTADELKGMEEKVNFPKKRELVFAYVEKPENAQLKRHIDSLKRARANNKLNQVFMSIADSVEKEYLALDLYKFTPEQVEAYTTIGGTPHLDQNYTVFGEVIEGLNIIDSIANVNKDRYDRPIEDVIMKIKVVKK